MYREFKDNYTGFETDEQKKTLYLNLKQDIQGKFLNYVTFSRAC